MQPLDIIVLAITATPFIVVGYVTALILNRFFRAGIKRAVAFVLVFIAITLLVALAWGLIAPTLHGGVSLLIGIILGAPVGFFLAIHLLSKWDKVKGNIA